MVDTFLSYDHTAVSVEWHISLDYMERKIDEKIQEDLFFLGHVGCGKTRSFIISYGIQKKIDSISQQVP
jgi:predicted ATPase